jgi:hypothetical protein
MNTIQVIGAGILLLGLLCLAGRWLGGAGRGMAKGARLFLPLWFAVAGYNMWYGIYKAGFSLADESRVFALVFGAPALVALLLWWKFDPSA